MSDVTILAERSGERFQTSVKGEATAIEGVHKIRWYGERTKNELYDYFSLVHVLTGRALNKTPLSSSQADQLIAELIDSDVDFDQIVDVPSADRYYVRRLTKEAKRLAGAYND